MLHADETPVAMLKPAGQRDGKTRRAYLWSYCSTQFSPLQAVVFDFADSRGASTPATSLACPERQASQPGKASSSATTSPATRPASNWA